MIKNSIKSLIRSFGWDIHGWSPASSSSAQLLAALNYSKCNLAFDIGANVGQFAQQLRSIGFRGSIISFEPLTLAHSRLLKASRHDPNWLIHHRVAVGGHDGSTEINVAGNSVSSSVLPMLSSHSSAVAESAYVASEHVPLIRLDSVAHEYISEDSRPFIKIDTQGFEWQVLDGATETLKLASCVLLELSLVPLYEGQRLWSEVIQRMEDQGFTLWAIQKGFTDQRTGRTLQIDGIFLRE
jgi:FkbM family methyltransferase